MTTRPGALTRKDIVTVTASNNKQAALDRLTQAREALANASPAEHESLNREVVEAEKAVRFGRVRGWDYPEPDGE